MWAALIPAIAGMLAQRKQAKGQDPGAMGMVSQAGGIFNALQNQRAQQPAMQPRAQQPLTPIQTSPPYGAQPSMYGPRVGR